MRDKDGRLPHRESAVAMPYAEEVLVTRSDLEERATAIAELRDTVEELQVPAGVALPSAASPACSEAWGVVRALWTCACCDPTPAGLCASCVCVID